MDTETVFSEFSYQPSPTATTSSFIVTVLVIVATWLIYKKANEAGWAAIIPFYNVYVLFKITWGNGWKFLLLLIPIANVVIYIITLNKLSKAFGKGSGFTVGLFFLSVIFLCILAFGNAQYLGVPQKA